MPPSVVSPVAVLKINRHINEPTCSPAASHARQPAETPAPLPVLAQHPRKTAVSSTVFPLLNGFPDIAEYIVPSDVETLLLCPLFYSALPQSFSRTIFQPVPVHFCSPQTILISPILANSPC